MNLYAVKMNKRGWVEGLEPAHAGQVRLADGWRLMSESEVWSTLARNFDRSQRIGRLCQVVLYASIAGYLLLLPLRDPSDIPSLLFMVLLGIPTLVYCAHEAGRRAVYREWSALFASRGSAPNP